MDVQKQREGGTVIEVLHNTLGRAHSRILGGAGAGIVFGLLGPLVGQDEADIGLVASHRGNAGVDVNIIVESDIVVAVGGDGNTLLTEDGVEPSALIQTVVVVLLHDQICRVDPVTPGGNFLAGIVLAFAGDGIDQHGAVDVGAAEHTDGLFHFGADPVRLALFVDLKDRGAEHIGGILEAQMTLEVPSEQLGVRVFDALSLGQTNDLYVLADHVDVQVGGDTVLAVGEPFDQIAVFQKGHADGTSFIVDLVVLVGYLELADHIGQLAQFAVAQFRGGVLVQHGDLVEGDLLNVGDKVAFLHRQKLGIGVGAEDDAGQQRAYQIDDDQSTAQQKGNDAVLLHHTEKVFDAAGIKGRLRDVIQVDHIGVPILFGLTDLTGEHSGHTVNGTEQKGKDVKFGGMQVDGRQFQIEINKADDRRYQKADQGALGASQGFSFVHKCTSLKSTALSDLQPDVQDDLQQKDNRETEPEAQMPGLVTEEEHSGDGADTSAQKGRPEQDLFGDAPQFAAGTGFVDAHQQKGRKIDQDKIGDRHNRFLSPKRDSVKYSIAHCRSKMLDFCERTFK